MDMKTVERHSGAIKRALFICRSCGCGYEAEHKRKFCIPCADAKERERWKAKEAARRALRAAEGRSWKDRTPEEREARRKASRQRERAVEKAKRRANGVRPMAEVIAERKAKAAARRAERIAAVAAREAGRRSKQWNAPGLTEAERWRIRYRLDPAFNLREKLRCYERKEKFGRYGEWMRSAIKAGTRSPSVESALGYTIEELKRHLERQFTKAMSWASFCSGDIHIDHIRPLSSFDMTDFDQVKEAWALTNLRPLWAKDNLEKRDKRLFLL